MKKKDVAFLFSYNLITRLGLMKEGPLHICVINPFMRGVLTVEGRSEAIFNHFNWRTMS